MIITQPIASLASSDLNATPQSSWGPQLSAGGLGPTPDPNPHPLCAAEASRTSSWHISIDVWGDAQESGKVWQLLLEIKELFRKHGSVKDPPGGGFSTI